MDLTRDVSKLTDSSFKKTHRINLSNSSVFKGPTVNPPSFSASFSFVKMFQTSNCPLQFSFLLRHRCRFLFLAVSLLFHLLPTCLWWFVASRWVGKRRSSQWTDCDIWWGMWMTYFGWIIHGRIPKRCGVHLVKRRQAGFPFKFADVNLFL